MTHSPQQRWAVVHCRVDQVGRRCTRLPHPTAPTMSTSRPANSGSSQAAQPSLLQSPSPPQRCARVNVSGTKYPIVRIVAGQLGMEVTDKESEDCELHWVDTGVPLERYMNLKSYQFINRFAGMGEICRKDSLARNMLKMKRTREEEYDIVPRSWILPSEYSSLTQYMREHRQRGRHKTYIMKPPNGSMGNGISLVRSPDKVQQGQSILVQEYLEKPMLLDGFKFDLRVYVLVTSCNPLRIFVYRDGLVRLSTKPYRRPSDSNLGDHFMHLTNYSINKHSDTFDNTEEIGKGSKRTLKYFNGWLMDNGYNVVELWAKIHDVVIKTLLVAHPQLKHSYSACRPGLKAGDKSQCFEILGFDIFLDESLKPWVLEVNSSPSFGTDSQLDLEIKTGVIADAIRLVGVEPANDKAKRLLTQRSSSTKRLVHSPSQTSREPYDFLGEYEDAISLAERKANKVRQRLMEVRKEKALIKHEQEHMGDYIRIYPSPDAQRQYIYQQIEEESARISFTGVITRPSSRRSIISGLEKMREHELVDLLSQYESDDYSSNKEPPPSHAQTAAHMFGHNNYTSRDAAGAAMAARELEEERTQRVMLSLNSLEPSYPGKDSAEVKSIVEKANSEWLTHRAAVGSFWLMALDSTKRKQLLIPMREKLRELVVSHWRTAYIEPVKLNKIFLRLFNFLLSNHGQGLWSSFPGGTGESWEKSFKKKTDVLTMAELHCCRRVVYLCQGSLLAAYHYHHSQKSRPPASSSTVAVQRRRSTGASSLQRPVTSLTGTRLGRRTATYQMYNRKKCSSVPIFSDNPATQSTKSIAVLPCL